MITKEISLCDCRTGAYCAPEMVVIEISSEGIFCNSQFEDLSEEEGIW